jgi:serine/threonine-protein kinase
VDAVARLNATLKDRYLLEEEIGRGGMANVYRAQDLRHDRKVAFKVLKPALGAVLGAERFLVEIRMTATLQHPNILPLFDSGSVGEFLFYVMPYVEGETLRARMTREGQLPLADAIQIARGAASALGYAHRQGVIHRDIKPENILLLDGQALVADFGIALAVRNAAGSRITQSGISLGTPQYMSPEQAAAERQIDGRSDQYSLASVLFEMLVGEPPFTGPSAPAVIARLMSEPAPRVEKRRPSVPKPIADAIDRALQRVPGDRFPTVAAFADALVETSGVPGTVATDTRVRGDWSRLVTRVGLPVAAGIAVVAVLAWMRDRPAGSNAHPARLSIALPDSLPMEFIGPATFGAGQPALTLSPDGSSLVYVARRGASTQLALRRLDDYNVQLLSGTENAFDPVFSPTGDHVAFIADGELRLYDMRRGLTRSLAKVFDPLGIAWDNDDAVLVAQDGGHDLARVSIQAPKLDGLLHNARTGLKLPELLPGGAHGLATFAAFLTTFDLKAGTVRALSPTGPIPLDPAASSRAILGASARYSSGMLIYGAPDGSLMAAPFDPGTLRMSGPSRILVPAVRVEALNDAAQFAVSPKGQLAFVPGANVNVGPLARIGRDGRIDTLPFGRARVNTFPVSPNGKRIVVVRVVPGRPRELWIYDLERGAAQQVPLSEPVGSNAEWVSDSTVAVLLAARKLAVISPDNGVTLRTVDAPLVSMSGVSVDGATVVGSADSAAGAHAIGVSLSTGTVFRLGVSSAREAVATLSPDGKWTAYSALETGQQEIYVEPVPRTGARFHISVGGGNEPLWLRSGELLYRHNREIWSVPLRAAAKPPLGTPVRLVEIPFVGTNGRSYSASPDGKFIYFVLTPRETTARDIRFMSDLKYEFRAAAPPR